jgi:cyanate lyase
MKRDPEQAVSNLMKPMKREDVTDLIAFRKIKGGIKWTEVAKKVGQSKEWTTAACLGQMQMTKKQAETVGRIFDLPEEAVLILQTVPYKGRCPPRCRPIRSSTAGTRSSTSTAPPSRS